MASPSITTTSASCGFRRSIRRRCSYSTNCATRAEWPAANGTMCSTPLRKTGENYWPISPKEICPKANGSAWPGSGTLRPARWTNGLVLDAKGPGVGEFWGRGSIKYGVMRRSLTLAGVGPYLQKNDTIVRIWVIGWCEWRMMRLLPKDWETYLRSSFFQAKRKWLLVWVLWPWVWRRVGVLGELGHRICFDSSS